MDTSLFQKCIFCQKNIINCAIADVEVERLQYDSKLDNMLIFNKKNLTKNMMDAKTTGDETKMNQEEVLGDIVNDFYDLSDHINDAYLVKINNTIYVCNLDTYMFATLFEGKEI